MNRAAKDRSFGTGIALNSGNKKRSFKMKGLLVTMTFLLSFSLFAAQTVKTTIYKIYDPVAEDPDYLILANNGHVYGISPEDEYLVRLAKEALATSTAIEISLKEESGLVENPDERSTVDNINYLGSGSVEVPLRPEPSPDAFFSPEHHIRPLDGYTLTSQSYSANKSLFRWMRNDLSGNSECYNRAHVWSWEMYKRLGHKSGKMFLFFTRRYINEYRYKWWFHVAPMINQHGEPQHMILDRQYTRGPLRMHDWTDIFMRNDPHCPVVDRYSSYSQNQYSRYCYLIPASMYYWQPYNLDRLERYHTQKWGFVQSQVNHAYNDALRWRRADNANDNSTEETTSNEVPENSDSTTSETETTTSSDENEDTTATTPSEDAPETESEPTEETEA